MESEVLACWRILFDAGTSFRIPKLGCWGLTL